MNILTQQINWKYQLDKLGEHHFFFHDLNCETEELKKTCQVNDIDLILCFDFEVQTDIINKLSSDDIIDIPWLLPNLDASRIEEKIYFNKWMHDNGYAKYLPKEVEEGNFPFVIRFGNGKSAECIRVIKSQNEYNELKSSVPFEQHICQEYIKSDIEFAHHFISLNGQQIISQTYRHLFKDVSEDNEYYLRGGEIHNKDTEKYKPDNNINNIIKSIISDLNYTGCGCIDFKIKDNNIYILEFNARMGGSLIFYNEQMHDFDSFVESYVNILRERRNLPPCEV